MSEFIPDVLTSTMLLEYWEEQALNARTALRYAHEQKIYWAGKLSTALATGEVQDGADTEC